MLYDSYDHCRYTYASWALRDDGVKDVFFGQKEPKGGACLALAPEEHEVAVAVEGAGCGVRRLDGRSWQHGRRLVARRQGFALPAQAAVFQN